jgi:hypothetical protein
MQTRTRQKYLGRILRALCLITVLVGLLQPHTSIWSQPSARGIRDVDFKNFSFPWQAPTRWPDHLRWMSLNVKNQVRLVSGRFDERDEREQRKDTVFSGVTFEGVSYSKLVDDREEDAIVVLRYDTGGTQYHYWVYMYNFLNNKPNLLGFFHAGDRAYNGLYQVYGKDHLLYVKLFDPALRQGDCCSNAYIRYQFRWNGQGFEAVGSQTKGQVKSVSRRAVSIFGLPVDQENSKAEQKP